jgi:hypothetical protein
MSRTGSAITPGEIAAGIAKDAQEYLGGLDVVSVGPIFADEMGGDPYLQLYTVLPNREGNDFVVHLIILAHIQGTLLAQINPTALIMALETRFGRVQIFSDELAFAKYCLKERPDERMNQVVGVFRKRGLD